MSVRSRYRILGFGIDIPVNSQKEAMRIAMELSAEFERIGSGLPLYVWKWADSPMFLVEVHRGAIVEASR